MWRKVSVAAVLANVPVVMFTTWSNPIASLLSTFVLLNTTVRLFYPSSYCPASQSKAGWLFSPITARCLATVAEFSFCEHNSSIHDQGKMMDRFSSSLKCVGIDCLCSQITKKPCAWDFLSGGHLLVC
jgi:hypothetical protein